GRLAAPCPAPLRDGLRGGRGQPPLLQRRLPGDVPRRGRSLCREWHPGEEDSLGQVTYRWDAVVVGASFGGLAAAQALAGSGRVLLVDGQPRGAGQPSACGAPLPLLEWFGAGDAVEQVHELAVFHLPDGSIRDLPLPYPFATFDYERLSRLLFAGTDAAFLQATATGLAAADVVAPS